MHLKNCLYVVLLLTAGCYGLQAQSPANGEAVRIDTTRLILQLNGHAYIFMDAAHRLKPGQLPFLAFKDTLPKQIKITPSIVQKDIYLKFSVANLSDTLISCYFFAGTYFEEIRLYRSGANHGIMEESGTYPGDQNGFKIIQLHPHQTETYYAKLKFIKTTTHNFSPLLVIDYYRDQFIINYQGGDKSTNTMTFVFAGILLMMIFYSFAVYLQNKSTEFLFYAGYAFCLGLMLFLKAYF
jgi:hypothetical protein